jgi:thermitase
MSQAVWGRRRVALMMAMAALTLVVGFGRREGVDPGTNSLVVGLTEGANESDLSGALTAFGARVVSRIDKLHLLVVETPTGAGGPALAALRRHPSVRYAEPNSPVTYASAPSDEYYADGQQWNIDRVKAPDAWDLLPAGGNTVVAVIDTGIDYGHPEFAGRISSFGCDQFHGDCLGLGGGAIARDDNYHGTHVSGIIGANTNNRIGIASVSGGRVTIIPIKVLSKGGGGYTSDVLDAVIYAVDKGAKVINMSLGAPCGSKAPVDAWRDAITYADARDVLIVMAAGNDGGCWEGNYPLTDARIMSVAATDIADSGATFTSRGPWVSVAAPGVRILSTYPVARGSYGVLSGTSMATPHVSGQAALLYQVPGATRAKVMEWIKSTCDPATVSVQCGGRINVYRSVYLAVNGLDPAKAPVAPPNPPVTAAAPVAAPVGRFVPPALPPGFVPSELVRNTVIPALTAGTASNVTWTGWFWLSAPTVTAGICETSDAATRAAAESALQRLTDAGARGLAWRIVRDDASCDAGFSQPRIVITRDLVGSDEGPALQTTMKDVSGGTCEPASGGPACWAGVAAIAVNPLAFDQLADDQKVTSLMRELARSFGLGQATTCGDSMMVTADRCPGASQDLGADDIASLNELLAATLKAMKQ